jgi:hypothetical protein
MPDWNGLVRKRLKLVHLSPAQQDATIAELTSHLEDLYADYRGRGLNDSEATQRALQEIPDWRGLAENIERSKQEQSMNRRTKQFWLPGLINLAIAMFVLMFEVRMDLHPRIYNTRFADMMLYIPWLLALPFCGGFAAYLCRRAGGDRVARLATASFPAAAYLGCFVLVLPIARFGPDHFVAWGAVAVVVSCWVILPGIALLLGALPFLRTSQPSEAPSR